MRSITLFGAITFFALVCSTLVGRSWGEEPKTPTGQRWAILIRVSEYPNLRKIPFAVADQKSLAQELPV